METKKVLAIIFSLLFLCAFGFTLTWGIINFNKVKDSMSGTELYTKEDLEKSYNDGYNTALKDKDEYDELINGYRDSITELNDTISSLNSQIAGLTASNKDYVNEVQKLNNQKESLTLQIEELQTNKIENETLIDELNQQITELNSQITSLNNIIANNEKTINELNKQIIGLNTQIVGLNQNITNNENTIASLRIDINNLNNKIVELSNDKTKNENTISLLNNEILSLNQQIESLTNLNEGYIVSIERLNNEIEVLNNEKNNLLLENTNYYNTISSLNNQVINLQNSNSQLESANISNLNTIASLNTQIANLNSQINDITLQSQNNSATIKSLNTKISELQESISYYESYIASLENGEQVVVTFEFDGSVYNIQMINKGTKLSVTNPTSTEYIIFNSWQVDGVTINLDEYIFNQNTKVIADVTYKHNAIFKVDNAIYSSQIVTSGEYATIPENPTKVGYEFDGWAVNGINIVDVATTKISSDTTFYAVFTKLHSVNFVYEEKLESSQTIRNGEYATNISIENTAYKVFNGWKVNGVLVDVNNYKIVNDTTFVADITYKYDVVYMVDGETYNSQIIATNNYPTLPTNPVKEGYEFDGWSTDGKTIVNTSTISIKENTTYYAVFTKLYEVSFVYEDSTISKQTVRANECAKLVSVNNSVYKVFNGWKVNGELVNVNNYKINSSTVFIADITYKYDVTFVVDDTNYNTQIVEYNKTASIPNNPSKVGYEFDGWSIDNNFVDVNNYKITQATRFVANFTKLYEVSFIQDDKVISKQTVRENNYVKNVNVEIGEYDVFNGWRVNNELVDITNFKINANISFVADITYKYKVEFVVDEGVIDSQLVLKNNYVNLPENPEKEGYVFSGWSIDGENVVDAGGISIQENITFSAIFVNEFYFTYIKNGSTKYTELIQDREYLSTSTASAIRGTYLIDFAKEDMVLVNEYGYSSIVNNNTNKLYLIGNSNIASYDKSTNSIKILHDTNSYTEFLGLFGNYLFFGTQNEICVLNIQTEVVDVIYQAYSATAKVESIDGTNFIIANGNSAVKRIDIYNVETKTLTEKYNNANYDIYLKLDNGDFLISSSSNSYTGLYLYDKSTGEINKIYSAGFKWNYILNLGEGKYLLTQSSNVTPNSSSVGILYYNSETQEISSLYSAGIAWFNRTLRTVNGGYLMCATSEYGTNSLGVLYYNPTTNTIKRLVSSGYNFYFTELESGDVVFGVIGLYVFDPVASKLTTLSASANRGSNITVANLPNNNALIGSGYYTTGAYLYNGNTNTASNQIPISTGLTHCISLNDDEVLLTSASSGKGIIKFTISTKAYTTLYEGGNWNNGLVLSNGDIIFSGSGNFTASYGILYYNKENATFEKYDAFKYGYMPVAECNGKVIFVPTSTANVYGIYVFDLESKSLEYFYENYRDWDIVEVVDNGILLSSSTNLATPTLLYNSTTNRLVKQK